MRERRQLVRFVKTDGIIGALPVGEQREILVPADLDRRAALGRAWRMLKRDLPVDENQMCWMVAGEDSPPPGLL